MRTARVLCHASVNTAPLSQQAPSEVSPFSSSKHTWFASLPSCHSTLRLLLAAVQNIVVRRWDNTQGSAIHTNVAADLTHSKHQYVHISARNRLKLLQAFRPECYGLFQGKDLHLKTRAFWSKRWHDFQPITIHMYHTLQRWVMLNRIWPYTVQ